MAEGCRSGSPGRACLQSMHVIYVVFTILAALANGYAATLNFAGAESVKVVADKVQVSRRWMIPFGILLASGALGLLIDLTVKALSPVLPQKAAAASYGDSMIFVAAGLDQRTGLGFFHIEPTVGKRVLPIPSSLRSSAAAHVERSTSICSP